MHVHLSGNHFQQNKVIIPNNYSVINIYCVYKLDPIASIRDTSFTIQDALFGAMQITKNATDNSKNNYKGYGICFDERSKFSHTITEGGFAHTTNGRIVLIFEADMSFSAHATNRANHIYLMGKGLTQGINDTTIYVEKNYYRNFTDPCKKFVLSLHYNGDNSYLFVNGRQELKFKCKADQLVKEKLCIGNLSDQWTASESEKTGLYGNIYDFDDDTCRCDCNEDFAGIINRTKGYTWNPSTCTCECDIWCKPGQYLDHKNCVCKNKLVGRLIEECTSVINKTMMNNNNYDYNTIIYVSIGFFYSQSFVFVCLLILSGLKINILIILYTLTSIDNYKNKKINI